MYCNQKNKAFENKKEIIIDKIISVAINLFNSYELYNLTSANQYLMQQVVFTTKCTCSRSVGVVHDYFSEKIICRRIMTNRIALINEKMESLISRILYFKRCDTIYYPKDFSVDFCRYT